MGTTKGRKHFGFPGKVVIKKLIERYNKKQREIALGIIPRKNTE